MKKLIGLLFLCFSTIVIAQNNETPYDFNFDFENISTESQLPANWNKMGKGYTISVDTMVVHNGKNSIMISPEGSNNMLSFSNTIPLSFDGKEVEFNIYIKCQDVSSGEMVLALSADNLYQNFTPLAISGTTDWTEYSIKTPYGKEAKTINVSIMARGTNGKIWLDDSRLLIDGKDVKDWEPIDIPTLKADEDKEFDNGSGIGYITLDSKKSDNLKLLGLIWGFLKYHHPAIAAGNFNWDYELFRYLAPLLNSKTQEERDTIFISWINSLGAVEINETENQEDSNNIKQSPDLSWIENSNMDKNLVQLLLNIKRAVRSDNNYYIKPTPFVGNALFDNEREYNKMDYNDTGYRLLALYRYWNMMEYFNPNKHLNEVDWKNTLSEFIPKFIEASEELRYKLTVAALAAKVNDSHAMVKEHSGKAWTDFWGTRFAPLEIQFIENKAVVMKNPDKTSMKAGDIIISINGKKTEDIISEKSKYLSASNKSHLLYNLATNVLTRTNQPSISISYIRNGIQNEETIETYAREELPSDQPDSCFKFVTKDIAYLYAGNYQSSLLPEFMGKIKETKGLIVDLRCYPSDELIYSLTKYLVTKPTNFARFSTPDITQPGLFHMTGPIVTGEDNTDPYRGKVIILVNEKSISQSEFTAMALKTAPNTTVIGSQTGGADGNISIIPIPGGLKTCISGIGVYYPDGQETQQVGIVPDILISPTIDGIAKGKDEILEKAINLIK